MGNRSDIILNINNLSIGYKLSHKKKLYLHNNINCNIHKGELIALLGPNGAGKSTLIKTLMSLISSLAGDVLYNGTSVSKMSKKQISILVAVVLTDKIDDRYLTAYDIVGTGRYPHGSFTGRLNNTDKEKIDYAFSVVDAGELTTRIYYNLSDGEKQKVLLARAIAQDTPLIFLDEPTAYIDSPGKVIIMNLLKKLVTQHDKTILLTTHDTELALQYATKLWLLGKNDYFTEGDPDELIKTGSISKLFSRKDVVFNINKRCFEMRK